MRLILAVLLLVLASACSVRAPELAATTRPETRQADWPELLPLSPLLAEVDGLSPRLDRRSESTLQARAANLRRRAARLRALQLE